MKKEFPKMLYPEGECANGRIVHSEDELKAAAKDGFYLHGVKPKAKRGPKPKKKVEE